MQPKLIGGNNKSFRHQFWLHRAAITVAPYERPLISAFNIALNWWAGLCTEKTSIPFPFTLNYIWSWGQFSFRFSEPKGFPFGSKSKGKLSLRSYPIKCERKWKYSFLNGTGLSELKNHRLEWTSNLNYRLKWTLYV